MFPLQLLKATTKVEKLIEIFKIELLCSLMACPLFVIRSNNKKKIILLNCSICVVFFFNKKNTRDFYALQALDDKLMN